MSDSATELRLLRIELSELRDRVGRLELRGRELEGLDTRSAVPAAGSVRGAEAEEGRSSAVPPGPATQVGESPEQSWTFREEVAREIGAFVRRALAGEYRGQSGRNRITLASRIYLIFRDKAGNEFLLGHRRELAIRLPESSCGTRRWWQSRHSSWVAGTPIQDILCGASSLGLAGRSHLAMPHRQQATRGTSKVCRTGCSRGPVGSRRRQLASCADLSPRGTMPVRIIQPPSTSGPRGTTSFRSVGFAVDRDLPGPHKRARRLSGGQAATVGEAGPEPGALELHRSDEHPWSKGRPKRGKAERGKGRKSPSGRTGKPVRRISMTAGPMAGAPAACTFARPASSQAQSLSQPPGIKVLGSGASTFSGVGFFKGALRRILDTSSGFGYFARSLVSHSYAQDCTTTPRADGFPMPLPYVEVMKPGLDDSAAGGEIALKRGVNSIILALNYLHLGRPRRVPACIKLGSKLSRRQWEMVRVIKEFARVWVEISPIGPSEMGRGASKAESMEGLLDELSARASSFGLSCEGFYGSHRFTESSRASSQALPTDAAGSVVGRSSRSGIAAFQPIEPSRLQFLGTPSFDPRPFMDPLTRAIYEDPIAFAIPFEQYGGVLPRVRVHCSYHKKIQLFKLLDQTKRLTLQAPAHVDPQLCAGLFSVVKSATRDRLILDARPRNCLEIPIERWIGSLAGGEALVNIVLPPACELRVSSNDLRDFYYFFSVGGARASRNIFAGAVRTQDLQGFNALKSEHADLQYVYGSLNSLAMGDLQAVAIAQTCHLGLGIQHGIFDPRSLLTSKGPVPRGPEYYGIVIDDYVSISAVPSSSPGPTKASKQADKIVDVYQKVHLLPHEEKATRDQVISEFWGVHLDGSRGQLRGSLKRSVPLAHIAMDVARLGYCSVDLMQTLIGSFISLLLFRRRLLAILNALFQTVRGREPHDIVRLSGEARSELLLLALLLPVACTNLRAPVSPRVTATDASQWGEGAVEAHLPEQIAREVH